MRKQFYTYIEFIEACHRLNFTSQRDYKERYTEDPRLPCNPNRVYPGFLFSTITYREASHHRNLYSYEDFLVVCQNIKFTSKRDYKVRYKLDPMLPSRPDKIYPNFSWTTITGNKSL